MTQWSAATAKNAAARTASRTGASIALILVLGSMMVSGIFAMDAPNISTRRLAANVLATIAIFTTTSTAVALITCGKKKGVRSFVFWLV